MNEPFELSINSTGQLVLKRAGKDDVTDVRVQRAFPWSNPRAFISLRGPDSKEVLLIEDLGQLAAAEREAVDRALGAAAFIPRITHVDGVVLEFGFQMWQAQTDRGPVNFRVQEREDIRFLSDGRFILKDADGNLYELPKLEDLDAHSRVAVEVLI